MKTALVYDRINKWGGAERVLLALHELFPKAPLFTSVYNPKTSPWAKVFTIKTSFLERFPSASSSHELYPLLMPITFESFSFDEYDVVISVTSEAAKGIITKPHTLHVCYCLTPTRYLWSARNEYFRSPFFRFITDPAVSYLRRWDQVASQRPDAYIAISQEVRKRIKKYYKKDALVIYPPVTLGSGFELDRKNNGNYFLVVSRLVPYKRVDIAIAACNQLKFPLVVIGSGSEEQGLRRMAGSTVTFLGNLTDRELVEYYKGCSALIFPGNEDFGLTILEAQQFGKPVIALREAGALESILEGKTGEFFFPKSIEGLLKVLQRFDKTKYRQTDCIEQAKKFSKKQFQKHFLETIEKLFVEHKKRIV